MTQFQHPPTNSDPSDEIIPPLPATLTSGLADEPETRRSRSGCLWGIGGALGCVGILLLIPTVLIVVGTTSMGGLISSVGGLFGLGAPQPATANIISTQTIVQGIQPLGQLVSISSQLAKADVAVSVGQGALNACGYSASHVVQGTIEAGIDLTQIQEADFAYDEDNDRYVLILPAPQLTSCRIDYIRQYDRSSTVCAVDWDEARLLANYISLNNFRDEAVEGGILSRAEQEARLVIGNFIRLVTNKTVEVIFRPAPEGETVAPSSCNPTTPAGWSYNPANGNWEK